MLLTDTNNINKIIGEVYHEKTGGVPHCTFSLWKLGKIEIILHFIFYLFCYAIKY